MRDYSTQATKIWKNTGFLLFIFCLVILRILSIGNCLIYWIFKIPCPECGLMRAYLSLFKGNIIEGFQYHPLFLIPLIALFLFTLRNKKSFIFKHFLIWWIFIFLFAICYIIRLVFDFFSFLKRWKDPFHLTNYWIILMNKAFNHLVKSFFILGDIMRE